MDYFEIIRMILLVIIMSAAVVDDCRRYRISNRIIICGFIAAAGVFFDRTDYKRRCNAIFDGVYCWLRGNVSNIYS